MNNNEINNNNNINNNQSKDINIKINNNNDNNKNNNKLKDIDINKLPTNKDEIINVKIETEDYDIKECYISDDDEITEKQIKYIEHQIRNSYEYKQYIQYLKKELDLNKCELLPGIDPNIDPVSIELHHYPISLYDITEAVLNYELNNTSNPVSTFDVSELVMKEHYENNIGLVPLTSTLHEMAHNNSITIPLNIINGNYSNFIDKYEDYFSTDAMTRIEDNLAASSNDELFKKNKEKLSKKIMHYNIEYQNNQINPDDLEFFDK